MRSAVAGCDVRRLPRDAPPWLRFREVEERAQAVLDPLRIRRPAEIDIELIAGLHHLLVDFAPLRGEQGHLLRAGDVGTLTVDVAARRSQKWRFVVAHEIGHFVLHKGMDQLGYCRSADFGRWYQASGAEPDANVFAAEILMPKALFKPRCATDAPSLDLVRSVADEFQTTLSSTALRFPRFSTVPSATAFTTAKGIEWWNASEEFGFTLKRGRTPGKGTFAHDVLAGALGQQARPQVVEADEWTDDTRAEGVEVLEHSMKLGNYGVLTLLVRQGEDEEG